MNSMRYEASVDSAQRAQTIHLVRTQLAPAHAYVGNSIPCSACN